jgi:peptidyl-prolyl cis-trans isomerase C
MNKTLRIFLIYIFSIYSFFPLFADEIDPAEVIAIVNDKEITLGHLIIAVANLPPEYQNLENDYLFEMVLDQLVNQEVVAQSSLNEEMSAKFKLENEIRSIQAKNALENAIFGFPNEKQIKNAYQEVKESFKKTEEFKAAHILVKNKIEAQNLLITIENGVAFSELAKEKSIGPSAQNGGDLGWFSKGQMVPDFEMAVLKLDLGEISQPVKTQFGWHIIKLKNKRLTELPSLEDLRNELIQTLQQGFINEYISKNTKSMNIKKYKNNQSINYIKNIELLKDSN